MTVFSPDKLTQERSLIFRITHVDNVPWILENGIHCRNSHKFDGNFREIGHPEIISKRASRPVDCSPGGTLSDYVPFYFTPYSKMLYNIKTGWQGVKKFPMTEIVMFYTSLRHLADLGIQFVFSDRHANVKLAQFSSDLVHLDRIDWPRLRARDFANDPKDPAKSEKYQAEALVYREVPLSALRGMVCYGPEQKEQLSRELEQRSVPLKLTSGPHWYV